MKKSVVALVVGVLLFCAHADGYYGVGSSSTFDLSGRGNVTLPSGAVVHNGGSLLSDATWAKGLLHVVYGTVGVPEGVMLTIEPGAVVKFVAGGIVSTGTVVANGVMFTDIDDGAGLAVPSYTLRGNFETDAATKVRFVRNGDEFAANNSSAVFDLNMRGEYDYPDGAVAHSGGVLSRNETWAAGGVHVVYGTLVVPEGVTLTIEPGAVVKFVAGGILADGTCVVNGVTFTDIADGGADAASGRDDDSLLPMPSYALRGNFTMDGATRVKFAKTDGAFIANGDSGAFSVDTEDYELRVARATETITYDPRWGDGTAAKVEVSRTTGAVETLVSAPDGVRGAVEWTPPDAPGVYTLSHVSGAETLTAQFAVVKGAAVHGGTVGTNETWTADTVHVIGGNTSVPAGVTLTIEKGAVVKFVPGKILSMASGGVCNAEGVVFTSLYDDTAGGDSLADGEATVPTENGWTIFGMVNDSLATDYRYGNVALCGTLGADAVWRKEKTYVIDGTLTVAAGVTLTIPAGTVVKFTDGSSLALASGGACLAEGAIFTHIADDDVGGDTNGDGAATRPAYGRYTVDANVIEDDATEYRYASMFSLSGSLAEDAVLHGNRIYQVTNDVDILNGVTVTVGCGAVVKFAAGTSLRLKAGAHLVANGTRTKPVVFTSLKDDAHGGDTNGDGTESSPYPGDWGGVIANGAQIDARYAQFLYGGGVAGNSYNARASCFMWDGSSGAFDGCRFSGSPMDGCFAQNATFKNCIFDDNDRGLVSHTGMITADNCVAANNRIGFFSHTSPLVVRNSISSLNTESAITGDGGSRSTTNCYFGNDPRFLDPANGDYRIAPDSPCVDAGDAAHAPAKDYYGSPRYAMTYGGEAKPDIGIYEVLPRNVASDVDLEAVGIEAATDEWTVGATVKAVWTVRNAGTEPAVGPWTDALSAIDSSGAVVTLGAWETAQTLAPGASVTREATFAVPAMATGAARLRLTVNAGHDVFEGALTANNVATAARNVAVAVPVLDVGGATRLHIPARSSYAFTLPADADATVVLVHGGADVSVYGASGYTPTAMRNDAAAVRWGDDMWLLSIPKGVRADAFVIVVANGGAGAASVYVGAENQPMTIADVSPSRLPAGGDATVVLRGVRLDGVASVRLEGAATVAARAVSSVSDAELTATFPLAAAAPGTYTVVVTDTDGYSARLSGAVDIYRPVTGPELDARLDLPDAVRRGRITAGRIVYSNTGDSALRAPYFRLSGENVQFRLDGEEEWQQGAFEVMGLGGGLAAGTLAPGESGYVTFEFVSLGDAAIGLEVETSETDVWTAHAEAVAAAATRLAPRGRRVARWTELERYAKAFAQEPETSNAVCGLFYDETTGAPLAGVEVCASSEDGTLFGVDTVDADGVFILEGVPNATNVVLSVVEGAFADDLRVAMPERGDRLNLRWAGRAGWTVKVAVEGASAEDFADGIEVSYSDARGENSGFVVLTNGVDCITLKNEGLYILTGKTSGGHEVSCIVNCEMGDRSCEATLDFDYGVSVCGRVIDSEGHPVTNAVIVLRNKGVIQSHTVPTDGNGNFAVGCVVDGEYTIQASAYGYASDVAMPIIVDGVDVSEMIITLVKYGNTLSGTFPRSCTNGTAVLKFKSGETSPVISIQNDASFTVEGLPVGVADIKIYDCTGGLVAVKRDFEISAGGNELHIEAFSPERLVAGKAVNGDGDTLKSVWTFTDASSEGVAVGSAENGYAVTRLRSDSYWIRVQSSGYVDYTGYMVVDSDKEAVVALRKGITVQTQVSLEYNTDRVSVIFLSGSESKASQKTGIGVYACNQFQEGESVYAFVSYTNEAYYTSSCIGTADVTGEVARVSEKTALRVHVDLADSATTILLKHQDGSNITAAYNLGKDGTLELVDYPAIDLCIQAVKDDGTVLSEKYILSDDRNVELSCDSVTQVVGRVTADGVNVTTGGRVFFCDGSGNVKATASLSMVGTFRADFVPVSVSHVYVMLSDGSVFCVARETADAAVWNLKKPLDVKVVEYPVADETGNAVVGLVVKFIDENGFSVQVKTDSSGIAKTAWSAGTKLDVQIPPSSSYATSKADKIIVGASKKLVVKRVALLAMGEC